MRSLLRLTAEVPRLSAVALATLFFPIATASGGPMGHWDLTLVGPDGGPGPTEVKGSEEVKPPYGIGVIYKPFQDEKQGIFRLVFSIVGDCPPGMMVDPTFVAPTQANVSITAKFTFEVKSSSDLASAKAFVDYTGPGGGAISFAPKELLNMAGQIGPGNLTQVTTAPVGDGATYVLDAQGFAEVGAGHAGDETSSSMAKLEMTFIGPPDFNIPCVPEPEPASVTLLGIGIAGMAGYAWRRKRQRATV